MDNNELAPISLNALRASRQGLDYKDLVREQLAKRALYSGLGPMGHSVPMQELLSYEMRRDPRIALMLLGNSGNLMRGQTLGELEGITPEMLMARLGIERGNARAGVSGTAVKLPTGVKTMPGTADVGYSTPMLGGNLDVSGYYGLAPSPTPMYGVNMRYNREF